MAGRRRQPGAEKTRRWRVRLSAKGGTKGAPESDEINRAVMMAARDLCETAALTRARQSDVPHLRFLMDKASDLLVDKGYSRKESRLRLRRTLIRDEVLIARDMKPS